MLIPGGGLSVFFTLLIQSYGFSDRNTLLISIPGGLVHLILTVSFCLIARRVGNRMLTAAFSQLLSIISIAVMLALSGVGGDPTSYRTAQLVAYYVLIGNAPTGFIFILSIVSSNVAGFTKKTTVNGMVLSAYCVGFLIGPQTFRDPPYYTAGKYTMIAMYSAATMCFLGLWIINRTENTRRNQASSELPPKPQGQEFLDLTDGQNMYFRYAL
jgi:MFS transporter, ACS family, allantoate permease